MKNAITKEMNEIEYPKREMSWKLRIWGYVERKNLNDSARRFTDIHLDLLRICSFFRRRLW